LINLFSKGLMWLQLFTAAVAAFGLVAFPTLLVELATSCNAVARGNVTSVIRTDPFLCGLEVTVEGLDGATAWNATIPDVACSSVRPCRRDLASCEGVSVAYSRLRRERGACTAVVFSGAALPPSSYEDQMATIEVLFVGWAVACLIVAAGHASRPAARQPPMPQGPAERWWGSLERERRERGEWSPTDSVQWGVPAQ
jgi:hypothetical protein